MKTIIICLFLILSSRSIAQEISKVDFENSRWFTSIDGKNIFKSDTLTLNKIINFKPKRYPQMLPFLEMNYLKTDLFSTLDFIKNEVFIEEVDTDFCGFNFSDHINWQFDTKTKRLKFYKKECLIAEYEIISKMTDSSKWNIHSKKKKKSITLYATILTLKLKKFQK